MKKPAMKGDGHATKERTQGRAKGTGVNKKVEKTSVPQVVARNTYGKPSQTQKS